MRDKTQITLTDPNSKHFKKLEEIRKTKKCIICESNLIDTGVYFTKCPYKGYKAYYLIACKHCCTLYSSDFSILSLEYDAIDKNFSA